MKLRPLILLLPLLARAMVCPLSPTRPLEAGSSAPAFTLPDTRGGMVSRSDFEARLLLLNFWTPT